MLYYMLPAWGVVVLSILAGAWVLGLIICSVGVVIESLRKRREEKEMSDVFKDFFGGGK